MPEEHEQTAEEYKDQLEQHEMIKREGIKAWSEGIADMLPNIDEDKKIVIAEGFKALMQGPPSPRMPPFIVPPMPAPPPPHIYEHTDEEGTTTVYDWYSLSARATHVSKYRDGDVRIWNGADPMIDLTGDPAREFWKWKTEMLKSPYGQPVIMGYGR